VVLVLYAAHLTKVGNHSYRQLLVHRSSRKETEHTVQGYRPKES